MPFYTTPPEMESLWKVQKNWPFQVTVFGRLAGIYNSRFHPPYIYLFYFFCPGMLHIAVKAGGGWKDPEPYLEMMGPFLNWQKRQMVEVQPLDVGNCLNFWLESWLSLDLGDTNFHDCSLFPYFQSRMLKYISSWWLNQPLWKIFASQIGSFPQGSGWK